MIDDHELDCILHEIGREQMAPSDAVVRRTKQALHVARVLPAMVFLSLATQVLVFTVLVLCIIAPGASWSLRAFGLAGLCTMTGLGLVVVVAARDRLATLGTQLERVLSWS
jgi:hypothetical protein